MIKVANWILTRRCNLSCLYCRIGKDYLAPPEYPPLSYFIKNEMPTAYIIEGLSRLHKNNPDMFHIFYGGEPLLRDDLEDLIKECNHLGIKPCISTNAILLSEERAKSLFEAGLRSIQISIQGDCSEVHDLITNNPGSFKKAIEGLRNSIKVFPKVDVTIVCLKSNWRSIPKLYKLLSNLGLRGAFRVLRFMCYSYDMLKELILPKQYIWLSNQLYSLENSNIKIVSTGHVPGYGAPKLPDLIHPMSVSCYAGKTTLAVLPNGIAIPCQSLREFHLGNIVSEGIENIWNGEKIKLFSNLTPDKYQGKCYKCEDKWACYSCRAIANLLDGSIYGDDLSCEKLNPLRKHSYSFPSGHE